MLSESVPDRPYDPLLECFSVWSETDRRHREISGGWGSQARLLAAWLASRSQRPLLYITAHIPDADLLRDDLESLTGGNVELLPAYETLQQSTGDKNDPPSEIACERLRLCRQLAAIEGKSSGDGPPILAASVTALMQPVPDPATLRNNLITLQQSDEPGGGIDGLLQWLVDEGFQRTDRVEVVGEFAQRGGIVDVFAPGQDCPVRLDFFGDQIESIRLFDPETQRSAEQVNEVRFIGCRACQGSAGTVSFFDYLPPQTLVVLEESREIIEVGRLYLKRVEDVRGLYTPDAVIQAAARKDMLLINRVATGLFDGDDEPGSDGGVGTRALPVTLNGHSLQRFENQQTDGLADLLDEARRRQVYLFCENEVQIQRLQEVIRQTLERDIPPSMRFALGYLQRGFSAPDLDLMLLSHHELFGQHARRRSFGRLKSIHAIDTFTDLEVDDLVVHVQHGIGRFRGLKTLEKSGSVEEYLAIEFAAKAIVHVPVGKVHLIHKYVGAGGTIKLSKLGGKTWQRQKQRVADAIEDMAAELIEVQAHRQLSEGIHYPADTLWQREFEQLFPYPETPDQLSTADAIKADMQRSRPMDRLLCGDVGYGKTEMAIRGAFKAVEYGKQVAVLVPTTVLAQQHYRTFRERLANFPFQVEVISRFKSAAESRKIIQRAKAGQLDILIGTHRLLSADVGFKDLGLVIIDEEQRFGVSHKERLKQVRKTVDVLTLTATPIPRTLHLALLGIRDISALETPPLDRRSIVTEVCSYDRKRIAQVIQRELAREGQVYFVHNRVNNIVGIADTIGRLVPDARIGVAHGQMERHELEDRMLDFVEQRTDVLVCTTIIESGLDIPNANTMIVNDADRFGLAQLHQLRGRVGRYKNRAYAYMLLPEKRAVNPTALKRLKAIEEYAQLGSGFRIAMRDLEIRGAGNILGAEQSGHIDAVGYEMYCRLLSEAVRKKRNQQESDCTAISSTPAKTPAKVDELLPDKITQLDLGVSSHIPRSYIPGDRQRLEVYRRLATCRRNSGLEQLHRDLKDQFGRIPDPVTVLLQLAEIRLLAEPWEIASISARSPDMVFTFNTMKRVKALFAKMPQRVRAPEGTKVYCRLQKNYFESPSTILAFLRNLLTPVRT